MKIISYRPTDDQFWIACNKEEAEKWFIPLLDENGLRQLNDWFHLYEICKGGPDQGQEYESIVKEMMGVDEIAYAYFNVSRDLSVCYADVAHHPFHQLWNGYSPFCPCDHVEINSPTDLKDIVMTQDGKPFEKNDTQ